MENLLFIAKTLLGAVCDDALLLLLILAFITALRCLAVRWGRE